MVKPQRIAARKAAATVKRKAATTRTPKAVRKAPPARAAKKIAPARMQRRSYTAPDATRMFDKGKLELITLGGVTFGRATLEPGWRWATSVKPIVNTRSCEAPHLQYHVSGRLHVVMDDGSEAEFGPGEVGLVPPGHDAWVVGDEPVVIMDITGMVNYAARK